MPATATVASKADIRIRGTRILAVKLPEIIDDLANITRLPIQNDRGTLASTENITRTKRLRNAEPAGEAAIRGCCQRLLSEAAVRGCCQRLTAGPPCSADCRPSRGRGR